MMSENTTNNNNETKPKVEDNKNREFLLNKNITAESLDAIIKGILEINRHDEKQEEKDSDYVRKPIKLVVDSFGGDMYSGNALIGVIDTSETPIHGYCYGKVMSQGFMIYASCHYRYAHPIATFMYHDGGTTVKGMTEEMQLDIDQLRRLTAHGDRFLLETTNLTKEKLDEVKKGRYNWYLFAEEALEYGIVDELIPSKRNKNRQKHIDNNKK